MPCLVAAAQVLACALALSGASDARADVSVSKEFRQGRAVYVLSTANLSATVDPAEGVSVSSAPGGQLREPAPFAFASEKVRERPCTYQVADQATSRSTAVLILNWADNTGLRVEKIVSVLEGQQVVRLSYRIENGSIANDRLQTSFRFEPGGAGSWGLQACHKSGVAECSLSSVAAGGPVALDYVRWLGISQADGQGLAIVASSGALSELALVPGLGARLGMEGGSTVVPAGRILEVELVLVPFRGLGSLVNATEQVLCSARVDKAGATARVTIAVLPLSDLGDGEVALRLVSDADGTAVTVSGGTRRLSCGKAEEFPFYWQPAAPGGYRADLLLPGVRRAVPLGLFTCKDNAVEYAPPVQPPTEKLVLKDVPGWMPPLPADEAAMPTPPFFGLRGEPLESLRLDVGLGEREAAVIGLGRRRLGEQTAEIRLPDVAMRPGMRTIPLLAWELFTVQGPQPRGRADTPGLLVPAGGLPWRLSQLAALRLTVPEVREGRYRGQLETLTGYRRASLPLDVNVWPVRRPRPGLVRLHLNEPLCNPFSSAGPEALSCGSLAQHELVNVALEARDVLGSHSVVVQADSARARPLPQWLAEEGLSGGRLPPLDFSAINATLDHLILAGIRDVTVVGDVSLPALAPPAAPAEARSALAEWFWRGLADHLLSRGFADLCFMARSPVEEDDLTDDWFRAAGVLHQARWHVSGPYAPAVVGGTSLERLGELTGVLVIAGAGPDLVEHARTRLPAGMSVGVWAPGMPWELSLEQGRRYAHELARGRADLIAVQSVMTSLAGGTEAEPPEGAERRTSAEQILNSLAWEGFRDGMDELNYAAMLARYEAKQGGGQGASSGSQSGTALTKRAVLERLSALKAAGPAGATVAWNRVLLVQAGEPRAIVAVNPDYPEQHAQANTLNEFIKVKGGSELPVVPLAEVGAAGPHAVVVLFGSPDTNELVARLMADSPDLGWHLRRNGYMVLRREVAGVTYLALATSDPQQWGRPMVNFKAMLWSDGAD